MSSPPSCTSRTTIIGAVFIEKVSARRRYAQINDLLARLAADLEMDFWTLDAFWVVVLEPHPEKSPPPILETSSSITQSGGRFALERQLEEFLLENW